jgi:DNA invertase Pin-like site-specific DNA recombinase
MHWKRSYVLLIGYARTSTINQKYSLENQIEKLTPKGCEKIFSEEISSVSSNRLEFRNALEFARDGDTPLCQGSCPLLYFSLIFRWAG